MTEQTLVYRFVTAFPAFKPVLRKHIVLYKEVLPHVFFGEVTKKLFRMLEEDGDVLPALFAFFEQMADEGDLYVQGVLLVTILAPISEQQPLCAIAEKYMKASTKALSGKVEMLWETV